MKSSELSSLLAAATAAVVDACAVCRLVASDRRGIATMTKDDRSPVTVADYASQAVINHRLREDLGAYTMVAEESGGELRGPEQGAILARIVEAVQTVWSGATADAVLDCIDFGRRDVDGSAHWTLDPIDGTKGFLRGGQYAVSLAYLVDGEPVLGVLGCPNLPLDPKGSLDVADPSGAIFWATRGGGGFMAKVDDPSHAQVLHPRPETGATIRLVASVESGHSDQSGTARILDGMGRPWETVRIDSQAKYVVVARDQADLYLRVPTKADYREAIWDHAAGYVVAREAGCKVTDMNGNPLDFSRPPRLVDNRGIVCARKDLHPLLIDRIQEEGVAEFTGVR